jgi:hypothetical protein
VLGNVRRWLSYDHISFGVRNMLCGSLNHKSSAADLIYDKANLCEPPESPCGERQALRTQGASLDEGS